MLLSRLFAVLILCFALQVPTSAYAAADPHAPAVEHEAGGEHAVGLPMDWKQDLALFSLITFVFYVAVLRAGAWGPLISGLNARERGIRQNIADADANRSKSEAMLKEYDLKLAKVQDEVREILAGARREAEQTKQEMVAAAQKEAEATKQRAIAEIERSRDMALAELFDFVSNNVVTATEQVIGRSLTGADQERLVTDALTQLNIRRN